jgi:peptidoglycan-associated lipoprotein
LQEFAVNTRIHLVGVLGLIALIAGCGGNDAVIDDGDGGFGVDGAGGPGSGRPLSERDGIPMTAEELARQQEMQDLMQNLVVYFDFDESEILPEYNNMLAAHGEFLTRYPNSRVRLEGHADETGSREYNIGLGERRAQAVRRILLLQGASATQLSTVSYGEERPAALGSDEEAYSLNRRVELVYDE